MVKDIIHDPFVLSIKSEPATKNDTGTAEDMLDTIKEHGAECVGMAANMIGIRKRIIVFADNSGYITMFNPVIERQYEPYETSENCLSLQGGPRKCKRYRKIVVKWQNEAFQTRVKTFSGFAAQIIQHEIDHCDGVLI